MYDQIATKVAGQYELFLFALRGLYLNAMAPGAAVTPKLVADVQSAAQRAAESFLAGAETELQAHLAPYEGGDAQNALTQHKREAVAQLRGLINQNVSEAVRDMRLGTQNVGSMLKDAGGSMGLLLQKRLATKNWAVRDTSGRQWEAPKLARVIVRGFAVQADLDAAAHQADLLRITHPDPEHKFAGMVVSVSGADGYPSLESVRSLAFHPNTKAKAVPYVPAQ
ncbi:hypothetical protein C0Q88_07725 [Ralstonia pickettii]|uniref:Uncharacterized protein n=1 Tax=Ralstonia pickettii TaxID=329 RepID=A0A2N4TXY0_RALPI|nr:hypothetical protein [Ralstonia pickettii]PLC44560.1 hypothetical protein C0Q88_07725 [Ralstonia pickettii]